MGDYAGSYEYTGDEEVKYVVDEDWSWMHNTGTEDGGALSKGENFCEEEESDNEEEEYNYVAGINFEVEYSYTCDSSQQVAVEGGSATIRSASTGHQVVLVEDASDSSSSSKDDKPKLKPKTKKTKGARRQFKHLQELPLDASSDPGYGGNSESFHPEDAKSLSINLVTSWLQDAALEEHPKDGMHAQHGSIPPQRRPPPRRPPPGADMGAHSSRRSSSLPGPVPQYEYEPQYECEPQDYGKTPAWDPSGYQSQGYEEDRQVVLYDAPAAKQSIYRREEDRQVVLYDAPAAKQSIYRPEEDRQVVLHDAPAEKQSIYRPESKPLDKALKFMRKAGVGLKSKTKEMTRLAVPVLTPLFNAVMEETKEHLMGPDQGRGRAAPVASTGEGRGRGPGRGRGRGRGPGGPPMARPMQPMMRPGMPRGPRPGMQPGMQPVRRPGMGPPGNQHGMARGGPNMVGPNMARGQARGQGRGQYQPVGAWPGPLQSTDY